MTDTRFRLRRNVYDSLVESHGATTVVAQAKLTGVPRRTLYRILNGDAPSSTSVLRMTNALSVPIDALFERVREAA